MSEEQTTQVTEPVETTQQSTAPVAPTIATTNTSTPATWKETISEEFRNNPNIEKFTEIDALAKSYPDHRRRCRSAHAPRPTTLGFRGSLQPA